MSVGDVNSTERGSGARFNTGKPAMDLVPLKVLARHVLRSRPDSTVAKALLSLGHFQATRDISHLTFALEELGDHWDDCARAFDYGRRKYADWNWAKGMNWSVPLACAVRHLRAVLAGEERDKESGETHLGHVFCNIAMLLTFNETYIEGDDLPTPGML